MSVFALSRRRAVVVAALVVGALALAGRYLARADAPADPPAETVARLDTAASTRLVVHVVGAVRRPGLFRLVDGSRVADAVRRAGGATPRADLALVNLAAPVADGTQIVVPRRAPPGAAPAAGSGPAAATDGPVHLNTATLEQLDALPGVGPVTAQKILDFRDEHGAFASVDELDVVPGIGPARLEQLREVVAP